MSFSSISEFCIRYGIYIIIAIFIIWLIICILKKSVKFIGVVIVCLLVSFGVLLGINYLFGDVSISIKDNIVEYTVNGESGEIDLSNIVDIDSEYNEDTNKYEITINYGENGKIDFQVERVAYEVLVKDLIEKINTSLKN